jgi:lysophospholipase L1-like esterase
MWQDDYVHPSQDAYNRMARYLVRGVLDLEDKRKKMIEEPEPQ